MTYVIGRGVRVEIGTTEGSAKTVSAVTKANPGVATSTAHGLLTKSVGYFDTVTGMDELLGQAIRLGTVATNTFDLEGLDTSGYGTFTAGTFTPVSAFTTITPATEYQVGGGDADFIDTSVLLDNIKQQEVGPLNAQTVTIAIKKETVNGAGMAAVVAAARAGLDKVFRITLKDGSVRVFRGTPSIPNENVSVGGVGTGGFTVTVKRFLQEGAA